MDRGPAVALILAAATCSLFLSACTPPANGVNSPTPPSATPSAMPTPPETAQERRIRLDQEAAVAAYRAALAENSRVSNGGGAAGPTERLKAVATSDYLALTVGFWRKAKELGLRSIGTPKVVYVSAGGWSPAEIHVKACEDGTGIRIVDSQGRDRTPNDIRRYVQDYTVVTAQGRWKVSDVDSTPVSNFETYGCES